VPTPAAGERLYFFWDYDLTEADLRAILAGQNETEIAWAMTRLLEAARWDDIWKYVRLSQVRDWLPRLPLRPQTRAVWEHALAVWGQMDARR
jgi:hypothetical protein